MITRRKFLRGFAIGLPAAVAAAAVAPALAKSLPYQETSLRVMGTVTGRWSAKIARLGRAYSFGLQNVRRRGLVEMDYTDIEERVLAHASEGGPIPLRYIKERPHEYNS